MPNKILINKNILKKNLPNLYLLGMCYILVLLSIHPLDVYSRKERSKKIYPPEHMQYYHLGFSEVMADIFWLNLLQDPEYCENSKMSPTSNNSVDLDSILNIKIANSRCHLGWVYQMVNSIVSLAPKFKLPYRFGGEMLAIAVDDREGAKRIFDLGVMRFPEYWPMVYSASYLYLFELQNPARAAELLELAQKHGGPDWLLSLAGTLYSKSGQTLLAITKLRDFIANNPNSKNLLKLKHRLAELEKIYVENEKQKSL